MDSRKAYLLHYTYTETGTTYSLYKACLIELSIHQLIHLSKTLPMYSLVDP